MEMMAMLDGDDDVGDGDLLAASEVLEDQAEVMRPEGLLCLRGHRVLAVRLPDPSAQQRIHFDLLLGNHLSWYRGTHRCVRWIFHSQFSSTYRCPHGRRRRSFGPGDHGISGLYPAIS